MQTTATTSFGSRGHFRVGCAILIALACLTVSATAEARKLRLHKPARGFQMRMTPFIGNPGVDQEGGEYTVAPNREPMDIAGFEVKATPGTHHFVVWQYTGPDRDPADFWKGISFTRGCTGLGPQNGLANANLFGMLPSFERFKFPDGV